jgi:hypothetical protein
MSGGVFDHSGQAQSDLDEAHEFSGQEEMGSECTNARRMLDR